MEFISTSVRLWRRAGQQIRGGFTIAFRLRPGGGGVQASGVSTLDDLASRIDRLCRLEGTFTLRSGAISHTYFDKYRFEGDPAVLREVVDQLAPLVLPETEILAGLEMGGIPLATGLALATGLPAVFVRKQAKPYGTAKLAEGGEIAGKRLLIVEDVVTSGGQIAISAGDLRALGATVTHALCVIDREEGGRENLAGDGIELISLLRTRDSRLVSE